MLGQLQSLFYSPLPCALSPAAAVAGGTLGPPHLVLPPQAAACAASSFTVMPSPLQQQHYNAYLSALMLASENAGLVYQPIRVNWASSPTSQPKQEPINKYSQEDLRHHYHIFVGDLSPDIETHQLKEAFSAFGDVSDAKIIKDTATQKSKGYGFISFAKKEEAQKAIVEMNGAWLGSRAIRTNWATRKPAGPTLSFDKQQLAPGGPLSSQTQAKLSYDEVFAQSSVTNCTVYVGGLNKNLSDEVLHLTFSPYGAIKEVRVFKDKGYAFVRFASKEAAAKAICEIHGTDVAGNLVKCSWGKESNDQVGTFSQQQGQQHYSYASNGGQYYTPPTAAFSTSSFYNTPASLSSFNGTSAVAAAAAAATATNAGSTAYTSYPNYATAGFADYGNYGTYGNYGQYGAYGQ